MIYKEYKVKNLNGLGVVGLGPRLKRLSDNLYRQIDDVYKQEKIAFQATNFPLLQLLNENESMSVTELAEVLGQTHPAISQMSKKLEQKGWIYHLGAPRGRLRALTFGAQTFVIQLIFLGLKG